MLPVGVQDLKLRQADELITQGHSLTTKFKTAATYGLYVDISWVLSRSWTLMLKLSSLINSHCLPNTVKCLMKDFEPKTVLELSEKGERTSRTLKFVLKQNICIHSNMVN